MVQANREDVTRVFTNLLDNAIKYNRPGGRVFLRAGQTMPLSKSRFKIRGLEFPKRTSAIFFDEFYRVKSKETRTNHRNGSGTFDRQKDLEAHNGHIEVESKLHQGSTFRVLLPI